MARSLKAKVPAQVLERVKAATASGSDVKKPSVPQAPAGRVLPRAKVIAALKKLHPMD